MKEEKPVRNKFRIIPYLSILGVFLGGSLCFMWITFLIPSKYPTTTEEIIFLICFTVIFLLMMGAVLKILHPIVIIDEKGLHQSLFGKLFKKEIFWENIKSVKAFKILGNELVQIVFSKSDISNMSQQQCAKMKDKITFSHELKKINPAIKKYYGKDVSEIL